MTRHVVAEVAFSRGIPSTDAAVTCSCHWRGKVADWLAHRPYRESKRGQRNTWGCHPMGLPGMPCQRCGRLLEMGEVNAHNFSVRVRHVEAA